MAQMSFTYVTINSTNLCFARMSRIAGSVCGLSTEKSTLPWSWAGLSCSSVCSHGLQIRKDCAVAKAACEKARSKYDSGSISYEDYRAVRRSYEKSRVAVADFKAACEEVEGKPSVGKKVSFDDTASHRPDSEYRAKKSYKRSSHLYKPGRYADTSGSGFENTSNPPSEAGPGVWQGKASSQVHRRFGMFGDEVDADRKKRIDAALAALAFDE